MNNKKLQTLREKQDAQLKRGNELVQKAILQILRTRGILTDGFASPELEREIKGSDE